MTEEVHPQRRKGDFESWLTRHKIRSTALLMTGVGTLIWVSEWSMKYADLALTLVASTKPTGSEIALIIAAVQVPVTSFAGWVFKIYMENPR